MYGVVDLLCAYWEKNERLHWACLKIIEIPGKIFLEESSSLPPIEVVSERGNTVLPKAPAKNNENESSDGESSWKRRKREERKHEERHSLDSDDDKRKHKRNKGKRRHDSD
ncbi:hypothetical protein FRX31_016886 [Thalictrum thalictroides]|uniref:Uncharacterized protein n=1 Tax=Thalictrum thalictroides TaxID=46969 RepID=A0A7J6W9C1_THATH|nr:hypothetical protein FRX31_016886 [Thalictrum thalictroides]